MTDASQESRLLTPVFTDLADSTALKTKRGDVVVGEFISRHRAHVMAARRTLNQPQRAQRDFEQESREQW